MFTDTQAWSVRKTEYFTDHAKRCKICRSNRQVELHRINDDCPVGSELDSDLVALCLYHTQSVLRYGKKVADEYNLAEATEIWVRLIKAGKEPGREPLKASRRKRKTDRHLAKKRYTNTPARLRHNGRSYRSANSR